MASESQAKITALEHDVEIRDARIAELKTALQEAENNANEYWEKLTEIDQAACIDFHGAYETGWNDAIDKAAELLNNHTCATPFAAMSVTELKIKQDE